MSKMIEIEYKTMVAAADFPRLLHFFGLTEADSQLQTNTYFDNQSLLKQSGSALRIREFSSAAEITLKTPQKKGLLEVTQPLTLYEAQRFIKEDRLPMLPELQEALDPFGVKITSLQKIGSLKTKRYEIRLPEGILALDESWYKTDGHDFELELEVQDSKLSKDEFLAFLRRAGLSYQPAKKKIQRALDND